MKAIVVRGFGAPDVMLLEDLPDPQPAAGQVRIRVMAIGVNPVETYVREGKYGNLPTLPYTPGSDVAGVVEAVGQDVKDIGIGDRVYTTVDSRGAYAEKMVVDRDCVYPLPDKVSFQQGASVGVPCAAAWRALFHRGKAVAGETVLIHGATGAVGIAAIQLARSVGLTVIGTASNESGYALAREQGAHYTANHSDYATIQKITGDRGVDLIVEMTADKNLNDDLGALSRHGRVVVIGSHGPVEIDPRKAMGAELDIRGMSIQRLPTDERREMYRAITSALAGGVLRPLVNLELPLSQAAEAHRKVTAGDGFGKIVLTP